MTLGMASPRRRPAAVGTRVARPRRARRRPAAANHHHQRLAWYGGLAVMAVLEVIDWPVALVIAVGHEIAYRARTRALRELAEGIEAGA
jgi:hypothetical protein